MDNCRKAWAISIAASWSEMQFFAASLQYYKEREAIIGKPDSKAIEGKPALLIKQSKLAGTTRTFIHQRSR